MISQIFKFGGGAGIGSYVIVMRDGTLENPNAEKIRLAYDNGDNLYLSILDDVTEEALLPLTGYVDNNNILHLSGRDFDDNKTYEFSISGEDHEIDSDIIDGITLGDGTVPTEGGGSGITVPTFTATRFGIELPDVDIALSSEDCADIIENEYPIIVISHFDVNENISLTFTRNNSVSGIEKGEPYTNLQYDLVVDDDEDVYLIGLSFSDNDMKAWCMQMTSGGSGSEVSGTNDGTNWTSLTIDGDTYGIPQGGGGGNVSDLYLEIEGEPTQAQLEQIYTQKPDVLRLGTDGGQHVIILHKSLQSESETRLYYFNIQNGAGDVQLVKIEYSEDDGYILENYEWSLDSIGVPHIISLVGTSGHFDSDDMDYINSDNCYINLDGVLYRKDLEDEVRYSAVPVNSNGSIVLKHIDIDPNTGNWELNTETISGGGGGSDEIYPIAIVATPSSTNIELAPAQNITLHDMGEEAPGYTAAPYQTLDPVTYEKPYDAVLAEFGPGHQYLLPLVSADSNMLLYGLTDSSMPVFDDEHPCAIMIQLNGSSIDSVMMISGGTYGPDGTVVATSLKGYFYSDTEFSFNASGIRDTDIAAAISAGKLPVAIIEWKYKDYQSWCSIKSFDEVRYYFEGEYKENKFTLVCDGSYWRADWLPVYVEDKQLGADVDYANNKIYFRSLDAMREMQSGLPMVKLELHDYTQVSRPLLGYLQLTLASQSDDKSECYYTSTQIENGDVKVTTIYVASGHTYSSGSTITIVTLTPANNN